MKIRNNFSEEEIKLMNKIDIEIEDKEYTNEEIRNICNIIYRNGYMNISLSYNEAELYRKLSEKLKILSKVDVYKLNKYTKKEFDDDFYMSTILMHGVVWNNPKRINTGRKISGKEPLTQEEYDKFKKINEENTIKFDEYIQYLKQKYGEDLDAVNNYYALKNE